MFRATLCSSSGESIVSIQHLVHVTLRRWPFCVQVGKELHTKRSLTQTDIYQMMYWYNWFSWWWARGCSKHVENWNKYIKKNCASNWSFTKNHNEMHGQQNIQFYNNVSFNLMFSQVLLDLVRCYALSLRLELKTFRKILAPSYLRSSRQMKVAAWSRAGKGGFLLGLLDPEHKANTVFRNVRNIQPTTRNSM
jgi:hypothetical protein